MEKELILFGRYPINIKNNTEQLITDKFIIAEKEHNFKKLEEIKCIQNFTIEESPNQKKNTLLKKIFDILRDKAPPKTDLIVYGGLTLNSVQDNCTLKQIGFYKNKY